MEDDDEDIMSDDKEPDLSSTVVERIMHEVNKPRGPWESGSEYRTARNTSYFPPFTCSTAAAGHAYTAADLGVGDSS